MIAETWNSTADSVILCTLVIQPWKYSHVTDVKSNQICILVLQSWVVSHSVEIFCQINKFRIVSNYSFFREPILIWRNLPTDLTFTKEISDQLINFIKVLWPSFKTWTLEDKQCVLRYQSSLHLLFRMSKLWFVFNT